MHPEILKSGNKIPVASFLTVVPDILLHEKKSNSTKAQAVILDRDSIPATICNRGGFRFGPEYIPETKD